MRTEQVSRLVASITLLSVLVVILTGPLTRYGVLRWNVGVDTFATASLIAGIGGAICAVLLYWRRSSLPLAGAVTGLVTAAIFTKIMLGTDAPLHDITTDTANPPQFVAITPAVRGEGTNPLAYDAAMAPQQAVAYPDMKPLVVDRPPAA
ncbi:MAG: hypothetical protein K2P79_10695, partial [Sphingomonas sp.]|nr:hypothetical protein [Sphingomonas sp.]